VGEKPVTRHSPIGSSLPLRVHIVVAVFLLCYARVMFDLVNQWSDNAMFSYGFAVPLISGYLVWLKAETLKKSPIRPDYWAGVPVVLLGMLCLAVGTLGALVAVQGLSLVITLTGLVLLLFGREVLTIVAFPVLYLLLMVPVWAYPLNQLQLPSQRLSAEMAVYLLDAVGIPAFRQNTLVMLPAVTLEVLQECSGVNQLVAFLVIVIAASYLWLRTWPRRAALLGLAILVAYASNAVRIAMIGFMSSKGWRDASLTGPAHLLEGLAISAAGYVVIACCISGLARTERVAPSEIEPKQQERESPVRRPLVDWALVLTMVIGGVSPLLTKRFELAPSDNLERLPHRIGEWTVDSRTTAPSRFPGIEDSFVGAYPSPTGERRFQRIDDEIVREYSNDTGERVRLYVGYYRRQDQGKEIASEAGHVLQSAARDLPLELPNGTIQLKEVVQRNASSERGLLYWYDVNGRVVSDVYAAKVYTVWDALTRVRTNGAVVMIAWEADAGPRSQQARDNAIAFARVLLVQLRPLLPS
jgi:EpsI family protein